MIKIRVKGFIFQVIISLFSLAIFAGNYENTVHYVWMGNLDTQERQQLCALGPNRLDNLLSQRSEPLDIKIKLWVRNNTKQQALSLFSGTRIEVVSIDDLLSTKREFFSDAETAKVKEIIDAMELKKSYSFQADVLGIFVAAEFGGYYFDTTTYFHELPNLFNNTFIKRLGIRLSIPLAVALKNYKSMELSPWYLGDLQVFSAPQKGDSVFIKSIKKMIEDFGEEGWYTTKPETSFSPHGAVIRAFEEVFGSFPNNFEELVWIRGDDGKFRDLFLEKIEASSWRFGPHGDADTGKYAESFWKRLREISENK